MYVTHMQSEMSTTRSQDSGAAQWLCRPTSPFVIASRCPGTHEEGSEEEIRKLWRVLANDDKDKGGHMDMGVVMCFRSRRS